MFGGPNLVVIPEYVAARRLRAALVGREHTVISDVPYRRSEHVQP
jgi:hypothetical protein